MVYEPRTYRHAVDPGDLVCFRVSVRETDLQICARKDLSDKAEDLVVQARWEIEEFIRSTPRFAESMTPLDVRADAPAIVRKMARAATSARVGPMAAVAGAIAEYVAGGLAESSDEVIVENGGDVYLRGTQDRTVALWAGQETPSVGLSVRAGLLPLAVCTSSGTIGHSTSFGKADAVTVLAHDGALADAAATALANGVRTADDIEKATEAARSITGILGVVVSVEGALGAWGNVRLVALDG